MQTLCVISKIGLRRFLDVWMETYLIHTKSSETCWDDFDSQMYPISCIDWKYIYLQSLFRNCMDTFKRKLIIFIIDKIMLKDYYL